MIEELDDPYSQYPEFRKEIEKARKAEEFAAKKDKPHGGWRPGAGAPKKEYTVFRASMLVKKSDVTELQEKIDALKERYGIN